jgi:hypothetical protein
MHVRIRPAGLGGFDSAEVAVWLEHILADNAPYQPAGWSTVVERVIVRPGIGSSPLIINVPIQLPVGKHAMTFRVRCGITQMTIGRPPSSFIAGTAMTTDQRWPATLWEMTTDRVNVIDVLPEIQRK